MLCRVSSGNGMLGHVRLDFVTIGQVSSCYARLGKGMTGWVMLCQVRSG